MSTDQFLNQISTLIFGWEIVDFVTMINQKSTSQPKINHLSTKFQPFFNIDISPSNLVDFWLKCGWEVDFWLIIVTKSMISQPNINVEDGWGKLRLNVLICAHWVEGQLTRLPEDLIGSIFKLSRVSQTSIKFIYSSRALDRVKHNYCFTLSFWPYTHSQDCCHQEVVKIHAYPWTQIFLWLY